MKAKAIILTAVLIAGCQQTAPINQVEPIVQERSDIIIHDVPFTSQAPFADWDDERQQDGCEEASSLMAIKWVQNKTSIPKQEALETILAVGEFQNEIYGTSKDTDAYDTAFRIINDYFDYKNVEVIDEAKKEDIINNLYEGKLILVPAHGQRLGNPNFTGEGPEKHMLVIKGYNSLTKDFITNDPGTRNGEDYKYNEDVLMNAIKDYPTTGNLSIDGSEKKIIVVSKTT